MSDSSMKTVQQAIKDLFLNKKIKYKGKYDTQHFETGLVDEVIVNIPNENTSKYADFDIELHHSNDEVGNGLCTTIYLDTEFEII
jgi:hypothetical protein